MICSRFVKKFEISEGSIVKISSAKAEAFQQPSQLSQVQCFLLRGVCVQVTQQHTEKNTLWIKVSCGWVIATDGGEDGFVEVVADRSEAEQFWEDEGRKRTRMASAVAAMLVRSYSLPRAKRLARSLLQHAQAFYPATPLVLSSRRSIEDAMIALGGLSALTKVQVFEFIKTAAARQSDPPQSVLLISKELYDIVFSRPTLWVLEEKNVLTTEDIRIRNNNFIMFAAEGDVVNFERCLQHGQELTCLHSDLMYTALHAAADFGQTAIVARIIETGLSLNIRDPKRGQTALHFAAHNARKEVLALLLAAGADRQLACNRQILPYQLADKQGHIECCEMLKLPPPSPPSLEVTDISRHSVSWAWTPPVIDTRTTPVVQEYCLELQLIEIIDDVRDPPSAYTTLLNHVVCDLVPARAYRGRVRCRAASGWSTWSSWVMITTLAHVPETPSFVETLKISINALLFHWFPPIRDNGRAIDFYQIEVADSQTKPKTAGQDDPELQAEKRSLISKSYRLMKHKAVDTLKKYVTGLEPGRQYQCRVRAHNECGFSSWSEWSQPVAPGMGVFVNAFDSLNASVNLNWFQPQLSPHRKIKYFELQVCHSKGSQPSFLDTSSFANGGRSSITRESQHEDKYVTVTNSIEKNEFALSQLRAGRRYQVRVRFLAEPGDWLDWEDALQSDPFTLPATSPDPPVRVFPRYIENGQTSKCSNVKKDLCGENTQRRDEEENEYKSFNENTNNSEITREIDVSHDYITIEWISGDSNGEEIVEYDVEMALIRSYNVRDVIFAKDAFIGISSDGPTCDQEQEHAQKNRNKLTWQSVSNLGVFISDCAFKIDNLSPGNAYSFRVRQRNACGWSEFSKASQLICTYPSPPPQALEVLRVGLTFACLSWEEVELQKPSLTTLEFEVQIRFHDDIGSSGAWTTCSSQPLPPTEISSCEASANHERAKKRSGCKLYNLVEGRSYEARLRIRSVIGWSPWSVMSGQFRTMQ